MGYEELKIEGRNAVLEAFRSGKQLTNYLCWTAVRMVRCARLSESEQT